jgi:hypothetical protein
MLAPGGAARLDLRQRLPGAPIVDREQGPRRARADDGGMGTYSHWSRGLAWAGVALALLAWHGQAKAGCDWDIGDALVFESAAPATEHSLPCCAARVPPSLAAEKLRAGANSPPVAAPCGRIGFDARVAGSLPEPRPPDPPWVPYCARSLRLLR